MRRFCISLIAAPLFFPSVSHAELLDVPLQPDAAICRAIAKNNAQHVSTLIEAHSDCLKAPGDGGGSVCAKAQCVRLHTAMNQASTTMSQINSTCAERSRRSEKALQDAQAEQDRNRANSNWIDKIGTIESSASEAMSLNHTIEHPLERLASFGTEGLDALKRKIGGTIRTGNGLYHDPNAALLDEMFSRAGQANRSLTSSPFRAFITQGSLDSLYFGQSALLRKISEIESTMRTGFNISSAPQPRRFAPTPPPRRPSGTPDCSILADTEKSRQLSQTNQDEWLQLVTRCDK
jgi:hypothetical protein